MSLESEQQMLFDLEHKKLLLDEPPLQVLPSLACAIGLHEAIVLQQLHFRLRDKARRRLPKRMGRYWIYNSYKEWQREEFPFFSVRTVERIFTEKLERTLLFNRIEIGRLVLTEQLEKRERDRRKWYSIDYQALTILEREITAAEHANLADSEHANLADSEHANLADSERAKMADSKATKTTHKDINKDINKDTHTREKNCVCVF